ncbi:hypothetical protein OHA25_21695 [Nonomuraea sp. NBC_00507]
MFAALLYLISAAALAFGRRGMLAAMYAVALDTFSRLEQAHA